MERRILVVEDSPTQAVRLRLLLEAEGFRVEVAANGREGLERIELERPDLIISDVVMPEMDGYAFCQAVKSNPRTKRIPFVLLTQRNTPEDIVWGLERGADNFITKPFDDDNLLERVRRIFENLALREKGHLEVEVTLRIGNRDIVVSADKQQIVELLFATFDDLCQLNATLQVRERDLEAKARELEAANQQLQAASRFKSQFLANMSHELRTPLNSIIGFSELLDGQHFGPLTDKQQRYVQSIMTSGQHLLLLIDDILDLAKIEAGRIELQSEAFPLPGALKAALHMIRPQAVAKGLTLHLDLVTCPKTVVADPTRFKQILFNLLSNAVKFTAEEGKVTVAARRVHGSECRVQGGTSPHEPSTMNDERIADWVEISVRDTGIGIKAEDIPKLFQEFTQVDAPLTKRYQGTGLGLALTKRFVELHGGRVWVESAGEGQGSTFRFTLPLEGPPPGIAEADSRISS
jgi:signal transduction histidine kinase